MAELIFNECKEKEKVADLISEKSERILEVKNGSFIRRREIYPRS